MKTKEYLKDMTDWGTDRRHRKTRSPFEDNTYIKTILGQRDTDRHVLSRTACGSGLKDSFFPDSLDATKT